MMLASKLDSITRALFKQIVEEKGAERHIFFCPKCEKRMEPLLLGVDEKGFEEVWWTCSQLKNKKCDFPLNLPSEAFWVRRSKADREKGFVPPPNLHLLPARFHSLYPSLFKGSRSLTASAVSSRHTSREDSFDSIVSNFSSASSTDVEERNRMEVRRRIEKMPKPRLAESRMALPDEVIDGAVDASCSYGDQHYAHKLLSARYDRVNKAQLLSSRFTLAGSSSEPLSHAEVHDVLNSRKSQEGLKRRPGEDNQENRNSSRSSRKRRNSLALEDDNQEINPEELNQVEALVREKLLKLKALSKKRKTEREQRERAAELAPVVAESESVTDHIPLPHMETAFSDLMPDSFADSFDDVSEFDFALGDDHFFSPHFV